MAEVDDLIAAIREVARDGSVIDPTVVEALVTAGGRSTRTDLDRWSDLDV